MNVMKTAGRLAAGVALLALFSVDASAQVPGLTASASGRRLTIDITPFPGSTGTQLVVGTSPGSGNIGTVNLPLSITHIVVDAPDATYYLRAAATAGSIVGPFGQEVSVVVTSAPTPPEPCSPPVAPAVTATGGGFSVNVNWTPVSRATGYVVQWSRSPGGTELVEQTTSTSVTKFVGQFGTFFVRVVAMTPCGNVTSAEQSFTLALGGGPRTPNPPPGTIIPRATLGYAGGVIEAVARAYPGDFANSCASHTWLFRVILALRQIDSRWGLNYVRGWAPRMSEDIIAYNPTDQPDEGAQQVYLYDTIAGHCGPRPDPWFNDVTDFTWFGGAARDWSICNNQYCARWTLLPYLMAGFPGDKQQ